MAKLPDATEQSTYPVTVVLKDGDGVAITPNDDVTWSLTDADDNIINSREDEPYASPSSTLLIVLSGNDLVMQTAAKKEQRFLVVECTYDSDLGTGLPFRDQMEFMVKNLKKVGV